MRELLTREADLWIHAPPERFVLDVPFEHRAFDRGARFARRGLCDEEPVPDDGHERTEDGDVLDDVRR